jgi:hypothetical protein
LHTDFCYTTSTPFHSCTTAESHVQRTADTTVHACTSAEQQSWRASGGPLQDPCRHDATTPQETHFRVTGSSEMCLQELHVLRSLRMIGARTCLLPYPISCVLDPRRSVLRCVESGCARSACKFSHPRVPTRTSAVAQSAVVWYHHLICSPKTRRSRELHPSMYTTM